jgi:hypothetical protein
MLQFQLGVKHTAYDLDIAHSCYRLFINHPKIRHKVSANRTKYQISSLIFNFSGAQASKLGVLGISEA